MLVGSNVRVSDTLIPEALCESLIECISWMPLHFLNRWERFKSHELDMHWYYPVAFSETPYTTDIEPTLAELDSSLHPILEAWRLIKASHDYPVRLYECMLGANTFGTEGRLHQDIAEASERPRHRTALVYCNKEWKVAWAGETLVFDDDMEITSAVMPKPGRVMIIDGDPAHVGRSVSRICPTDRRVLVFKYWAV
ncbi:2OG-Fe(II) oxygenase [Cupriavidus sp. SW-Y-13]|uniref:2OG-Fe(II) oxygenase n=1 Tax=Cupriavidus sp. SW-Y-13 TaxID=2653854 RepID=UPI001365E07D|nr:2OG-Fe(II) oxygenase [Cupriavidus sp. SW-Y-13]MWL90507.1 hypothetical protein [Cupriavidus sp. SW-Y-13]